MYDGNGTSGPSAVTTVVDADLVNRLRALERSVAPTEISDLWVFPPLPELEESGDFVLFTRLLPGEMRRICAVSFTEHESSNGTSRLANVENGDSESGAAGTVPRNGNGTGASTSGPVIPVNGNGHANGNGHGNGGGAPGPVLRIVEYGRVPSKRVQRVVDGFRRRLGDDREPLHIRIDGCSDSWFRALATESSDS